uniref:Uncharacterized protein HY1 n=1 Tax=Oncidium hybrid cultivar TaxID=141207 RepID=F5BCP6_ONCHC|nr:hypothetical protein [Oncidium hybrid cultivar]
MEHIKAYVGRSKNHLTLAVLLAAAFFFLAAADQPHPTTTTDHQSAVDFSVLKLPTEAEVEEKLCCNSCKYCTKSIPPRCLCGDVMKECPSWCQQCVDVGLGKQCLKDFYWDAEHNHAIWDNFNRRVGNRMRDMFTDIRKSMQCPLWIGEDVWEALKAAWSTPDYIAKRSQTKKNRAADTDGLGTSSHTCRSILMTEHRRRMDNFPIEDEDHMSPSAAEGPSSAMPSAQWGFEKWKKVVSGKKKGRIYGLGSQGVAYEQNSTSRYSSTGPNILNEKLETMQVQMQESIMKLEMDERMSRMRAQFESMTARLLKQIKKTTKKKGRKKLVRKCTGREKRRRHPILAVQIRVV